MTTKNLDLDRYYTLVRKNRVKYPEWRYGQNLFNSLFELDPDLANSIRGTSLDPFYIDDSKDKKVDEFLNWLIGKISN